MKWIRIRALIVLEIKRMIKEPVVFFFTLFFAPLLIAIFGIAMGNNYGWGLEYSIFDIMVPGFLSYACLMNIFEVASFVARENELGIQLRLTTTPLTSTDYFFGLIISYTIKPLIQFILGLIVACIFGFNSSASILGYFVCILFIILLSFSSVGFGLITARLAKNSTSAGGFAFLFIVPQQLFATFIPPEFLGAKKLAWIFPSFYTTDGLRLLFMGTKISDFRILIRLGLLSLYALVIYIIGVIVHKNAKKKGIFG